MIRPWLVVIALVLCGAQAVADDSYSFLLKHTTREAQGKNKIYTVDCNGLVVVAITDLADILGCDPNDPNVPTVVSLCFGMDQTDRDRPHGDVHFSVSPPQDPNQDWIPVYGGNLATEPFGDHTADTYRVSPVDALRPGLIGTHVKSLEESDLVPTIAGFAHFPPGSTAGLWGGVTGTRIAQVPPQLLGFDYHAPEHAYTHDGKIYFTLDRAWGQFRTCEVLALDEESGAIEVAFSLCEFLQDGDIIDGLSLDLAHSVEVLQAPSVTFSLETGSPTLVATGRSGADIFQDPKPTFAPAGASELEDHLLIPHGAAAVDSINDFGGVVSIDPITWTEYSGESSGGSPSSPNIVLTRHGQPLDEYVLFDGGSQEPAFHAGTNLSPATPPGFVAGAGREYEILGSKDGVPAYGGRFRIEEASLPLNPALFVATGYSQVGALFQASWSWVSSTPGTPATWEVSVSGGAPESPSGPGDTHLVSGLRPGDHVLGVRTVNPTSHYNYATVSIPSSVPTPVVSLEYSGTQLNGEFALSLELEVDPSVVEVLVSLDGQAEVAVTVPAGSGAKIQFTHPLSVMSYGPHSVEVRGVDSAMLLSRPNVARVFVPRPVSGTLTHSVPAGSGVVTGLAHLQSSQELVVVAGGMARKFEAESLVDTGVFPNSVPDPIGVSFDSLTGGLQWTATPPAGFPHAVTYRTDVQGANPLGPVPVSDFSLAPPFVGGDLCQRADGNFIVAGVTFGRVPVEYRSMLRDGFFTPLASPPAVVTTNPWGQGGSAVASRLVGGQTRLIVPYYDSALDQTTAIVEISLGGEILQGVCVALDGEPTAITYVGVNNSNRVPHVVVATHTVGVGSTLHRVVAPRGLPSEFDLHRHYQDSVSVSIPLLDRPIAHGFPTIQPFTVAESFLIGDLDVEIELEHGNPEDLVASLVAPSGHEVVLLARAFAPSGHLSYRIDELSSGDRDDMQGNVRAFGSLDGFDGMNAAGTWTFMLKDKNPKYDGVLREARLLLARDTPPCMVLRGDVDLDGDVDYIDATLFADFFVGKRATPHCLESCDADGDDLLTPQDALRILNIVHGLETAILAPDNETNLYDCFDCGN